jgi:phenylacetate-CoA ligase
LENARRTIPYYRKLMTEAGLGPSVEISGPADLERLPVTTKAEIKRQGFEAVRQEGVDPGRCHRVGTSGSTGIPLEILRSPAERAEQVALWLRTLVVNGYRFHHKVLGLVAPSRVGEGRTVLGHFGLLRRETAHYQMPPEQVVDILLDYKPQALYGNRHQLDLVCLELQRRGIACDFLRLLVCGGLRLYENSRLLYREWLGVDPVDNYGCEEAGVLAHETPEGAGLRPCEDITVFEVLDEGDRPVPPGTPGRMVITTLNRKVQPFIRYDLGDLVSYEIVEDATGHPWRRITVIHGRENDLLVLPDGSRQICPQFLDILSQYPGLVQARAVQKSVTRVEIQVVGDETYVEESKPGMLAYLRSRYPKEMEFAVVRMEEIPTDPTGKARMFISEVQDLDRLTPSIHRPAAERPG